MGVVDHMGGHRWRFHGILARSLIKLWDEFEDSGVLAEKINHDGGEDTPDITGREAYYLEINQEFLNLELQSQKGTYRESTYTLEIPENVKRALDLVSGKVLDLSESVEVGPHSTVVLYLGMNEK